MEHRGVVFLRGNLEGKEIELREAVDFVFSRGILLPCQVITKPYHPTLQGRCIPPRVYLYGADPATLVHELVHISQYKHGVFTPRTDKRLLLPPLPREDKRHGYRKNSIEEEAFWYENEYCLQTTGKGAGILNL